MGRRRSPTPVLLLLIAAVSLAAPRAAEAQETLPVQIRADAFRYDRRTGVLTATGNVRLVFQDVRLRADALVVNLESGELTAEGQVILEVGTQSVAADTLSYNLQTRYGTLTKARTDYTGPLVLGAVHLRAERLAGVVDEFASIRNGSLTTCDAQDPLVLLTAEEITVYLNDRIVGRRVSLWLAGRKVFTWPYFQIFLRERRESRLTPVVGFSDAEGLFVKTTYSYAVNEHHYGFLHGDWMERLGVGAGLEHLYDFGGARGSVLLYRLDNRLSGGSDLHGVFNHTQQLGPGLRAFAYADVSRFAAPALTTTVLFGALDLAYATPQSFSYLFATVQQSTPGGATAWTGQFAHSQIFSPAVFGQAFLDLSRTSTVMGNDDEILPRVALTYYGPRYAATVLAETRWDVDGDRYLFDERYTLERLPEVTLALTPVRLGESLLVAQAQGGLAYFRETTVGPGARTLDAARADATVTLSGPVSLWDGTLGLRAFLRGSWYSTGAVRLFYGGRIDYTRRLVGGFSARLGFVGQGTVGNSPFLFDQTADPLGVADVNLFYQGESIFAQAGVFYDFQAARFGNVFARVIALPRPGWSMGLAASYNLQTGGLDRAEAVFDLQLSKDWRVEYLGAYEAGTGRIVHDRVAVTRTFCDCLAVSLSYRGTRGEVWLEGWLTALPWARGKIGIGQQGNVLFDLPPPPR